MTNFEHYKDKISDVRFAVVNGNPTTCIGTKCTDCLFKNRGDYCNEIRWSWLKEEYVEPKPKRIIDVVEFAKYLENGIRNFETAEKVCGSNGDYTGAIGRQAYANAFHELLGLVTLDNPPDWVKIEEAKND